MRSSRQFVVHFCKNLTNAAIGFLQPRKVLGRRFPEFSDQTGFAAEEESGLTNPAVDCGAPGQSSPGAFFVSLPAASGATQGLLFIPMAVPWGRMRAASNYFARAAACDDE